MAEESRRMPRREDGDQTPINLEGVEYLPIDRVDVSEFHDLPDGKGEPSAVHLILRVGEESDQLPPFVVRFKSRKTTDEVIVALIAHSKAVWPDDPVVCEGFDPDAICKCGRRIEEHLKGSSQNADATTEEIQPKLKEGPL